MKMTILSIENLHGSKKPERPVNKRCMIYHKTEKKPESNHARVRNPLQIPLKKNLEEGHQTKI